MKKYNLEMLCIFFMIGLIVYGGLFFLYDTKSYAIQVGEIKESTVIYNQKGEELLYFPENKSMLEGYTIHTNDSDTCLILNSERLLYLESDTVVQIVRENDKLDLDLLEGQIWYDFGHLKYSLDECRVRISTVATGLRG